MDWKRLLAYITGSVDQELLRRTEYLVSENRVLRAHIPGRLSLSEAERKTLAEVGQRLGRKALAEVASIVRPETILAWHRRLVARKFDSSKPPRPPGRPPVEPELEALIVRLATENRAWGYDRIQGAVANLGYSISDQSVGNILKRHGIVPALERRQHTTWKEFIRTHLDVLAATDFFTAEVWTGAGLITYYVLLFIRVNTRQVYIGSITPHPTEAWMRQVARNVTMDQVGFLSGCRYLLQDRDTKFTHGFGQILAAAGVEAVRLPPRSPNLNAVAERWVRSVREECLAHLILFGERSLRHALDAYILHHQQERNHQGKANVILFPQTADRVGEADGSIAVRERLGGRLKFYYREAA